MSLTPAQVVEAVRRANDVRVFPTLVPIVTDEGEKTTINPTPTQGHLHDFFLQNTWSMVDKYRQAKSSIVHDADILRHIAYSPGQMGLVVGDKEKTYKEQIRRIAIMYEGLPDPVKPPLARPSSSESIAFAHGGEIQGLTGGGENPAIGFSPDYAMITEYFAFDNFDQFNTAFFPSMSRRKHGVCRVEGTPGAYMSAGHQMYLESLAGKGRFRALFLAWWHDTSCWLQPPPDFKPTAEEAEYRKKLALFERDSIGKPWYPYKAPQVVSDGHLYFRRICIETEFHGDTRLFDRAFPPSPFEGWLAGTSPAIPQDAIEEYLLSAVDVPWGEERRFEQYERGCPYALLADGAGFGRSGDPSALTLVNMWDWSEAGSWEGREDPDVFAARIVRWQKEWDADVIVEANKDGVCASLVTRGCPKLHWSDGDHPGWYASETSKANEFAALVAMLRKREPKIRSLPTLTQMASWDGKGRSRAKNGGASHHFDRATTWLLFAYATRVLGHARRPRLEEKKEWAGWTADDLSAMLETRSGNVQNVLGRLR